ncbi:MAG: polysaccharide deacetylase family protein [Candidatus Shapirobacteria bacterium]
MNIKKKFSIRLFLFFLKLASLADKISGRFFIKSYDLVFCYHNITNDSWEYSVGVNQFAKQINYLKKNFEIVSLSELVANKKKGKRARAVITFDDGFLGVLNNAFPILEKNGLRAAVFVTGEKNLKISKESGCRLMNKKEIERLASFGWEIGYHTRSHKNLASLPFGKLKNEITPPTQFEYLAYPYGQYNKEVLAQAKKAGYRAAFTTDGGAATSLKNIYAIPRITISNFLNLEEFRSLLTPTGVFANYLFVSLWKVKDKLGENLLWKKETR